MQQRLKSISLAVLSTFVFISAQANAQTDTHNHAQESQLIAANSQYKPAGGYAPTIAGTHYVEPSTTRILEVGEKINTLTERALSGETTVQRLTERTYWAQVGFYNVVFYVGDKGVLLFDALNGGSGKAVLAAIAKVTDKPVTTLVYSHNHADHISDAQVLIDEAKKAGRTLNIVATDATLAKMKYLDSTLPRPTQVIPFNNGSFKFENTVVKVSGFERAAHTDDSAAWLVDGVLHAPDMTNPDQMPYLAFGGSENYYYLPYNLSQMQALPFKFFSGGHGNIGGKADLEWMQNYLKDLKAAVETGAQKVDAGLYWNAKLSNHQAAAHDHMEAVVKASVDILRPKYGQFYGFEASAPYQAEYVFEALGAYK
jgi:glyoxylase-like metal-dependent hydrolase (beta-lactamase superfamily II)